MNFSEYIWTSQIKRLTEKKKTKNWYVNWWKGATLAKTWRRTRQGQVTAEWSELCVLVVWGWEVTEAGGKCASARGQSPALVGPSRVSYVTVIVRLKINNERHKMYFILTALHRHWWILSKGVTQCWYMFLMITQTTVWRVDYNTITDNHNN